MRSLLSFLVAALLSSCASVEVGILSPDKPVHNLTQNELARLSVEQMLSAEAEKFGRCGYEMAPGVWKLAMRPGTRRQEDVQCPVPANMYLLVSLAHTTFTIMNPKATCDAAEQEALKSLQRYKEPAFSVGDVRIARMAGHLQAVGQCPDPFKFRGGLHKLPRPRHPEEYPTAAAGYYAVLAPLPSGMHRLEFSVTNECWSDQRDPQTGECPKAGERRTVVMHLSVGCDPRFSMTPKKSERRGLGECGPCAGTARGELFTNSGSRRDVSGIGPHTGAGERENGQIVRRRAARGG